MSLKQELGNYNAEELSNFLTKELEEKALKDKQSYLEFLQFVSTFRSRQYSMRNQMLLYVQASEQGFLPVFGTFDEWKQKGTSIKSGEHGLTICRPVFGEVYYEKFETVGGKEHELRYYKWRTEKNKIDDLEKRIAEGDSTVRKVNEITTFIYTDSSFSLSQTTMPEQDRIEYLQRYNAENTSEENTELYAKLTEIAKVLGRNVVEKDIRDESLGWVEVKGSEIAIKKDMPIDSKCAVLTHEIGHTILHINNSTAESRSQKEVQAELFSHLTMLKLGIDAQRQYSLSYLNNYLKFEMRSATMFNNEGKELTPGEVLQKNLSIVLPAVDTFVQTVGEKLQPIDKDSLNKLKNLNIEKPERNKQTQVKEKVNNAMPSVPKTEAQLIEEGIANAKAMVAKTGNPYVVFHWSEDSDIKSGEIMPIEKADARLSSMNEAAKDALGYDKTKLDIYWKDKAGKINSYTGCRYDIGSEEGGLVKVIDNYIDFLHSGEGGEWWTINENDYSAIKEMIAQSKVLMQKALNVPKTVSKEGKVAIEPLKIFKETEKAVLVKIPGQSIEDKSAIWLPRSQISVNKEGAVYEATPFLIKNKGLTAKAAVTMKKPPIL